jgi:hypothetical protein
MVNSGLVLIASWFALGSITELRGDVDATRSNAEVMTGLCWQAAESFCAEAKIPDTAAVSLIVESGETNRFFTPTFIQVLRQRFSTLYTRRGASSIEISASVDKVNVAYGEAYSEGLFSGRKCSRTIDVRLQLSVTRNEDGRILWAGREAASRTDTVYVADIRDLEKGSQPVASGVAPAPSLLERFFEPVIIVGAAGVAVYLFFTIRS